MNTPNGDRRMPTRSLPIARDHGFDHLEHEARAVLDRAAVAIRALVRCRADELLEQVTVCPVQLDTVESGGQGIPGRLGELGDRGLDVGVGHRLGHRVGLHALGVGVDLSAGGDRRRPEYAGTGGQVQRMGDATAVHELHEHLGPQRADRVGDEFPARNLRCREDARYPRVAEAVWRRRHPFGHDQSGGRALRVVLRHQFGGDIADGAVARHRCHDEAVLQRERAQGGLRKQVRHDGFRRVGGPAVVWPRGSFRLSASAGRWGSKRTNARFSWREDGGRGASAPPNGGTRRGHGAAVPSRA